MFTKKQMKVLSKYEYQLKTAYKGDWVSCLPSSAVRDVHDALKEGYGINLDTNPSCSACILQLMKFAGERYFKQLEAEKNKKVAKKD